MYSYSAYGLGIASSLELPELEPANRPADISFQVTSVDRARPGGSFETCCGWATLRQSCMILPDVGALLISDGREILIDPKPGVDESVIRLFLLGPALAILLHQRGYFVLHASAVVIEGEAIAFVGEKGQGKSTMASALHARGHPLLVDDFVAVDLATSPPSAYPGFPQMKLWPEAAAMLGATIADMPRIRPDLEKRSHRLAGGFAETAVPLRQILALGDGDHEAIEPLPPHQAFMRLIDNSYLLLLVHETNTQPDHFRKVVRLAGAVPVMLLKRRRKLELLADVARLVEEQLAGQPS